MSSTYEFRHQVPVDTGKWVLQLRFEGIEPQQIKCATCDGKGKWGPHFRSFDDEPTVCTTCYGSGSVRNPKYVMPDPPPELAKILREAMRDAQNKYENLHFKLVP